MKNVFVIPVLLFCLQANAQQQKIDTTDLTVDVKYGTISATLFQPAAVRNAPVVLLIAGSGPTDRDGNSRLLPGKNNSLLLIADTLAQHGIACLRYDKRGVGESTLIPGIREDSILFEDMVNDAEQLYLTLKKRGYQKIFIAGHSEGSLVGMALAARVRVTGFISIAGAGRKAQDILKEQLASLPEALKSESYAALDSLSNGYRVRKVSPALFSLFRPSVQPYMISWFAYDPDSIIHHLDCDVLLLQGTNDLQVKEKDATSLKEAHPDAKLVLIPRMNHVLKEVVSDDRNENIKSYSDPTLPVMKELTDEIIKFVYQKHH